MKSFSEVTDTFWVEDLFQQINYFLVKRQMSGREVSSPVRKLSVYTLATSLFPSPLDLFWWDSLIISKESRLYWFL